MIAYDLHIHSCLSPCAEDEMSPNNIVNMAVLKGLDMIAVTDHNSLKQVRTMAKVAKGKIKYIYGVEIESIEAVHLLAYFIDEKNIDELDAFLEQHLLKQKNNSKYYGNQNICNEFDEVVGHYDNLLIMSCDLSIDEISKKVHDLGGIIVIAHALDRTNSIITQLGFIPSNFKFDAIEVKNTKQKAELLKTHPHLKDAIFLYNSDAHRLVDINEAVNYIDEEVFKHLWRSKNDAGFSFKHFGCR